ncbi:hypothetical protein JCM8547_002256 [Rhodosporidiobolus lusitaniae]
MVYTIPAERALYCANPDAYAHCIKICAAADVVSIGVRIGSYLQAIAYFALVLFAPDEGGAESMWLGLSVSFSFLAACYVQLFLATITLHHVVIVTLLSHLPYLATLAGMNSLTSYEVLGPSGVLFLQTGMLLKSLFTALLWAMCLFAFFVGQLPEWTHLQFRQANCFDSTALVVWLFPVRRTDESQAWSIFLIVSYSIFWFIVLCAGSYWTLIAPRVLVRRGGHLRDPHKRKIKGFNALMSGHRDGTHVRPLSAFISDDSSTDDQKAKARQQRRDHMEKYPYDYNRDDDDDDLALMTMRSVSKTPVGQPKPSSSSTSAASIPLPVSRPTSAASASSTGGIQVSRSVSPPPATEGMTAVAPWSKGLRGTDAEAAERWSKRESESRHHFIIWPIVAVLLTFTIITIELQMVVNDVFEGEMHLDFPGALTLFLAFPTAWAVIKAMKRIQEGRRPTPEERTDKTFWESASRQQARRRRHRRREEKHRALDTSFSDGTDSEAGGAPPSYRSRKSEYGYASVGKASEGEGRRRGASRGRARRGAGGEWA